MRVTVLGCSGSYAAPDTSCTGYLVQSAGKNVLLDCGPGVLANLQSHIALERLDAVVLTHCHPDHWVELPILCTVCTWFIGRTQLPVFGTTETQAMNRALCGGDPGAFAWQVIDEHSTIDIGDQRWTFSRTDHPVETLAVRVDSDGRSFAFSSDTGPAWAVDGFLDDVDLLICEASYTREREPEGIQHLSARQAGELARGARVGQLVLTHQLPGADVDAHAIEGADAFGRPVSVAHEHVVYTV
ncbi:MAG: MBL fold metallo-hydrolase [Acidimicrobiales bacterium]